MATLPIFSPCLTRRVWTSQAPFRCYQRVGAQRRWAQVSDVRFVATHQQHQKVLDKYKEKLDQKAREKGLKNVDELKEVYADKIEDLRNKAIVPGANAPLSAQQPPTPQATGASIPFQPPPPPNPEAQQQVEQQARKVSSGKAPVKTLDSFLDVEKTAELPAKEIETLWRLRHARDPQSLCAAMTKETYDRIAATAKKHPQFILPLPREEQGAEIHFLQWTFPSPTTATVLFTHLAEYKLRGEFAQPHTTVTHHLDLKDKNELVLLEGRVMENRGISVEEGKWLLMCLQKFYGFEALSPAAEESKGRRQKLMQQFSGGDETFKVEELLEEAEKVP
ncbi:ATP11-domain-containing protein [Polychaeton citri CBS 116435]|uniref:ATP11-domain-containing protein n=1 Tax=Polychaeton citri CBS 116435 TaxID=1314669 RepID=A0A9P4Q633_9PEZI|nr:ATP11-domain-containing protein [Polychaeton citri CBS 116435]